jgi:ribonuclease VapC
MILDSSAVIAILLEERGFERLLDKADTARSVSIGAPALLETKIALSRKATGDASLRLGEFLEGSRIGIVSFTAEHLTAAFGAFERFGKGRHPAKLNFGDCMSYAIAYVSRQPLLFIGDDFSKTDIEAA